MNFVCVDVVLCDPGYDVETVFHLCLMLTAYRNIVGNKIDA